MEKLDDESKDKKTTCKEGCSHDHETEDLNSKDNLDTLKQMQDLITHSSKIKKGEQIKDQYKFWDTQPVPNFKDKKAEKIGPIDEIKKVSDIRPTPYSLPKSYSWVDLDLNDKKDLTTLYEFLRDNYVEDDDHMFRFDYSPEFLHWHLTAPGYLKKWHCAVFKKGDDNSNKIVGFISGIPVLNYIHEQKVSMVEINFLCVNSAYRAYRLAPVLIKEITRRVNLEDIWQAVYTSGTLLPRPIVTTNYYHRNLNLQKLIDIKFTYLSPKLNLARAKKLYSLSKETTIQGLRPMTNKDVEGVYLILEKYLSKFKVRPHYCKKEVEHWFVPKDKIVYSYVVEDIDGKITDFLSFYLLPSSILQHDTHKTLYAAYSFFNVANTVSIKELIRNALVLAKKQNFDVYNALNIMENEEVLKDLLFGKGDGSLKYYFYNYLCPEIQPSDLGIVLM